MKPGRNDIPIKIKISGRQLEELQKYTWQMIEAFGLDTKIDNYQRYLANLVLQLGS